MLGEETSVNHTLALNGPILKNSSHNGYSVGNREQQKGYFAVDFHCTLSHLLKPIPHVKC